MMEAVKDAGTSNAATITTSTTTLLQGTYTATNVVIDENIANSNCNETAAADSSIIESKCDDNTKESSHSSSSNNNNRNSNSNNNNNNSNWGVLCTLYLPILFFWFRRSMFGSANLIRSLVVGQLMRLVFVDNIFEWMSAKFYLPRWLRTVLLFQSSSSSSSSAAISSSSSSSSSCIGTTTSAATSTSMVLLGTCGSGRIDPHAWPPPAFTALALLTIFALVIHPDGLTWILLAKLRDAMLTLLTTLAKCWEFLVSDYGVFPTIVAASTFAIMLFLVFIVLRTLSPKNRRSINGTNNHNVHHNEKKRRKKKGGNSRHKRDHNNHHHHHNINHHHRSSNRITYASRSGMAVNNLPVTTVATTSPPHQQQMLLSSSPLPTLQHSTPHKSNDSLLQYCPSPSSSDATAAATISSAEPYHSASKYTNINVALSAECKNESNVNNLSSGTKSNNSRVGNRRRMMSASTTDTISMSDDQSCGSISVRSSPSVSVSVTSNRSNRSTTGGDIFCGGDKVTNNIKMSNKNNNDGSYRRGKRSGNLKASKHNGNINSGKKKKATVETVSSRWDALKPDHHDCNSSSGNINGNTSCSRSSGNVNNRKKNHHQQQHESYHGGNDRRGRHVGGNDGSENGQDEKRRQNTVVEPPLIDPKPSLTISNTSSLSHSCSKALSTRSCNSVSASQSWYPSNELTSPTASTSIPYHNSVVSSISNIHVTNDTCVGLNPFASSINMTIPPPPPGFHQPSSKKEIHLKDGFLTAASPPTLFDTSPPKVIDNWRTTEISLTTATQSTAVVKQRDNRFPEFLTSTLSSTRKVQDNPFSDDNSTTLSSRHQLNNQLDNKIETELQELGGQMARSILDF